jgi:hypothetical protein
MACLSPATKWSAGRSPFAGITRIRCWGSPFSVSAVGFSAIPVTGTVPQAVRNGLAPSLTSQTGQGCTARRHRDRDESPSSTRTKVRSDVCCERGTWRRSEAWRTALTSRPTSRSSMPVTASPRVTDTWSARLAARRSILRSPARAWQLAGVQGADRGGPVDAGQFDAGLGDAGAGADEAAKSSWASQDAWAMIRPACSSRHAARETRARTRRSRRPGLDPLVDRHPPHRAGTPARQCRAVGVSASAA